MDCGVGTELTSQDTRHHLFVPGTCQTSLHFALVIFFLFDISSHFTIVLNILSAPLALHSCITSDGVGDPIEVAYDLPTIQSCALVAWGQGPKEAYFSDMFELFYLLVLFYLMTTSHRMLEVSGGKHRRTVVHHAGMRDANSVTAFPPFTLSSGVLPIS